MAVHMLAWPDKIFGKDGMEWRFPIDFWISKWPKTSNDNGLMFLRNHFFHIFQNVSWHSARHYPQFHSLRYRVLNAVCSGNIEELE
jgi:hypothetical protein